MAPVPNAPEFPAMLLPILAQAVVQTRVVHSNQGWGIGWFTLSLINAGLAQNKGHSGLGWWAGSLLLGPIATFIIVAVLDRRPLDLPQAPYVEPYADPSRKPGPIDF
jgi:hypothetical protein